MFIPKKFEQYIAQGLVLNSKGVWCTIDEAIAEEKENLVNLKKEPLKVDDFQDRLDEIEQDLAYEQLQVHEAEKTQQKQPAVKAGVTEESRSTQELPLVKGVQKSVPQPDFSVTQAILTPGISIAPIPSDKQPVVENQNKPAPSGAEPVKNDMPATREQASPFSAFIQNTSVQNPLKKTEKDGASSGEIRFIEDTVAIALPKRPPIPVKESAKPPHKDPLTESNTYRKQDTRIIRVDKPQTGHRAATPSEELRDVLSDIVINAPTGKKPASENEDWYNMLEELNDGPQLSGGHVATAEPVRPGMAAVSPPIIPAGIEKKKMEPPQVINENITKSNIVRDNKTSGSTTKKVPVHGKANYGSSGKNRSSNSQSLTDNPDGKSDYSNKYNDFNDKVFTEWDGGQARSKLFIAAIIGGLAILVAIIFVVFT
jgi:hypothetical protein